MLNRFHLAVYFFLTVMKEVGNEMEKLTSVFSITVLSMFDFITPVKSHRGASNKDK